MICWMALVWAVEPSPVIEPAGQARVGPEADTAAELAPVAVVVALEQAARESALRAATAAIFETRIMLTIILQSANRGRISPPALEARHVT
jgi:hypothetical protein